MGDVYVKLDDAIAAVDKHYDEMWRSRQYHQAEGNEESVGRLDARCRTASQIAEALRALPVSDGVTDEMADVALTTWRQYFRLHTVANRNGDFVFRSTAKEAMRAALEAALGPLPAPPSE